MTSQFMPPHFAQDFERTILFFVQYFALILLCSDIVFTGNVVLSNDVTLGLDQYNNSFYFVF